MTPTFVKTSSGFIQAFLILTLAAFFAGSSLVVREFVPPETNVWQEPQPLLPRIPPNLARSEEIRPGDMLFISVAEERDLTAEYIVDVEGNVSMPLIGTVPVGGLTPREAERRIRNALADDYVMDPCVTVEIERSDYQTIFVLGAVRSPGIVTAQGSVQLSEVLALAGPTAASSRRIVVARPHEVHALRPSPADVPGVQTLRVERDDPFVLRDGDTVYVPAMGSFHILGAINDPGEYMLDSRLTVGQAIALARGFAPRGSARGLVILRVVNGAQREVAATLDDAIEGGDVVRVRGLRIF